MKTRMILLLLLLLVGSSSIMGMGMGMGMAEEIELYSFTSREEMVQMAGYGEEKLSTVLLTGTVVCELCHSDSQLRAWPISGALVAVKCQTASKSKSGSAQATTDEYGEFVIDLPSHLHGVPDLQKACQVKVLQIPKNSNCRPAFVKKHKGLKFSSIGNGIRTYTSGKIRFQHITSKPLKTCIRRARASSVKQTSSMVD